MTEDEKIDLRTKARNQYGSSDVEIDPDATFSVADGGVWVHAWLWVADEDVEDDHANVYVKDDEGHMFGPYSDYDEACGDADDIHGIIVTVKD